MSGCPASEATSKATVETLLVEEVTYTIPVSASTYPAQVLPSPLFFSSITSSSGRNAAATSALIDHSTGGVGKSTLSTSTTPSASTIVTPEAVAPLSTSRGSFSHFASWTQAVIPFGMASIFVAYL